MKTLTKSLMFVLGLYALGGSALAQQAPQPVPLGAPVKDYAADEALAKQRVSDIVNQPVTAYPRTPVAAVYSPGWFDPGATTPDWDHVDVRTTQQLIYSGYRYVTSNVTPDSMYAGDDLEFNAMTKYFYADRLLPKHRLDEAEMEDINRLYRLIGRDEHALTREHTIWVIGFVLAGLVYGAVMSAIVSKSRH